MYEGNIIKADLVELYEGALYRCGQFMVRDVVEQELGLSDFVRAVKYQVYPFYTNYFFRTTRLNVRARVSVPIVFSDPVPEFISKVMPVGMFGLGTNELMAFRFSQASSMAGRPLVKLNVLWKYEKPALYISYDGDVIVEAQYQLRFNESEMWMELVDVTRDLVQELCNGLVLVMLGRSRRMLKVPDNVVEFDAEAMVSEGEELYQRAREQVIKLAEIAASNF